MANLTITEANSILDARLALVTEVRLVTANGTATTAGTEVAGGSYAPATGVTWAAAANGASSNTSAANFTAMPAVTIVGVELWGGGVRRWYGPLAASRTLAAGDDATFAAGDIDVTLA